jgi:hypothetical protein
MGAPQVSSLGSDFSLSALPQRKILKDVEPPTPGPNVPSAQISATHCAAP